MLHASYDPQFDQVVGPNKHLQVLMVGGVFAKWRMPVDFMFSRLVSGEILRRLVMLVIFLPAPVFFSLSLSLSIAIV